MELPERIAPASDYNSDRPISKTSDQDLLHSALSVPVEAQSKSLKDNDKIVGEEIDDQETDRRARQVC
jgi:hypothetical protein